MCGIVGSLAFDNSAQTVDEATLVRMREVLHHRGPDGSGTWLANDRKAGLGHRRLSIIDLSDAAGQPMCNDDGSLWIAYNGEVYNHAEIRRELEATGRFAWKTDHSDTEVVLRAFEHWGIECVHRFTGMFAIAIWDTRKRELWLVRDRIGIKPVYYANYAGRFSFASEIKALLADPALPREINDQGLFHFLSFLSVPAPDTMFAGIHKLPAATWMRVRADGQVTSRQYWDVLDHTQPLTGVAEQDIAGMLLDSLRSAVRLRKVSDVPVGVFLSGGIDSSTNAALFSEGEGAAVKSFSIGYDQEYDSYRNELEFARMAAEHSGALYHERILGMDDLVEFLPQLVYLQDEPIADPVCVPVYYVSKLARDNGVTVCQVGEGADELFCGYPQWLQLNRLDRLNRLPVPAFAKRAGLAGMAATGRKFTQHYEWLRRGASGLPIFWGGADVYSDRLKRVLLPKRLHDRFAAGGSWEAIEPLYRRFTDKAWEPSFVNWMSYADLNNRLPELLLMRVDKMTMATSLEARVPFLDHNFVELAMSVPSELKTRNGVGKYILKEAVRGTIPDSIIDRKKQGFGLPLHDWFQTEFRDYATGRLRRFCDDTGLLNYGPIDDMLNEARPASVWPLLNLALWWDGYFANPSPAAAGGYA